MGSRTSLVGLADSGMQKEMGTEGEMGQMGSRTSLVGSADGGTENERV